MFGGAQAIGRIVLACLGLVAVITAQNATEQGVLYSSIVAIVLASRICTRERFEQVGAAALGLALPILPWIGHHVLLAPALLFFAVRPSSRDLRQTSVKRLTRRELGRPDGDHRHASAWSDAQSRVGLRAITLGASRENPMDGGFPAVSNRHSYLAHLGWIVPLLGYALGSVVGELLRVVGVLGADPGGVIGSVRVDGFMRSVDLTRSLLDVHIPSWDICARVVLVGLTISFFASQRGALSVFVSWLYLGCAVSAVYVISQWCGILSIKLPNQTPVWDALGRPSGLLSDPNALGLVLALTLWVVWLHGAPERNRSKFIWCWTALLVVAGVVSGSRTFLLATGLLLLVAVLQRARVGLLWVAVGCAILLIGAVTLLDAYSGLVEHLVAHAGLPVGARRGLAALSILRLDDTFMSRGIFVEFARAIGRGHWLFGVGADRFIDYVPRFGAELDLVRGWRDNSNNFYLGLLVELGLVGVVAFFMTLLGRRLRGEVNKVGAIGSLIMLGVIACTGPHTDFVEVALLVSVLVAMTTEMRRIPSVLYLTLGLVMGALGIVATTHRESGAYGWSATADGATRWLTHAATVEVECREETDRVAHAHLILKPRYIPQTEPLRLTLIASDQPGREFLFRTAEPHELEVPCASSEERMLLTVKTQPAWSPYRAWPRASDDRRILGVEQVFVQR